MQTILGKHWHHLPAEEVVQLLESDLEQGLDLFEIHHRQERFGKNQITPAPGKSPLVRFLLQLHNPLIYVLLASSVITALIKDPADALIILVVVLINAVIGYIQESRAEQAIQALTQAMTTRATVIRSRLTQEILSTELVPGDIVLLQAGMKVPADLRLLRVRNLQVAEAALTGESLPVEKNAGDPLPPETVLADRSNMVFASTLATYWQATGIVVATGDSTEIGRISQLISEAHELQTPLTRKIDQFSRIVVVAILALAAVTFGVGVLRGQGVVETFTAAVALAVAMIPEGLPAVLTLTLAIGVTRMARRRAIIRKLPAVETLGGVTVICSDKTGTLTQNQMTVQEIVAGGTTYHLTGSGYAPEGQVLLEGRPQRASDLPAALRECLAAGILCNDSRLSQKNGQWLAEGDPTETALLVAAGKALGQVSDLPTQMPRIDSIPFESQHQYMATLHSPAQGTGPVIYLKGGVEVVSERCSTALDGQGREIPLPAAEIQRQVGEMARRGLRVLAFARGSLPAGVNTLHHSDVAANLTFLGIQAMIDPPRKEAIEAVAACQGAGIKVKMITGDHPATAAAIAVQIGLAQPCDDSTPPQDCTLSGKEIAALSDRELIASAERVAVFARVSPEQKLRLVEALQARGNIIAMTGDGVNDGPALKQANVGVAMGITGTDVAKEAADMILTDDNFATIAAAVEEGRAVFDNLSKIIAWILPTNLGEGMIIVFAILAGLALPILPIHILYINTVTAAVLGLVLALEPKENNIMQRPPRRPDAPILTGDLLRRIVLVGVIILLGAFGLHEIALAQGMNIAQARTVAVNTVVIIEIFYLLNCRSLVRSFFQVGLLTNTWLWLSLVAMLLIQLLFTYAPFMNDFMSSAPIGWEVWLEIAAVGVVSFLVVELDKRLQRRPQVS